MPDAVRDALLQASTLLYLFRALAVAESPEQRHAVELHIVRLVNEVSGTDGGFVILAPCTKDLIDAAATRDFSSLEISSLADIVVRAASDGIIHEAGITAAPLYARENIAGVIGVLGPDCSEVLGALVSLASTALESAREFEDLRSENLVLKSQTAIDDSGIIGESPAIQNLKRLIERVAPQEATALILGESGTGKELIARAIHLRSRRSQRPFVAINCAVLTETLLESELFGHERGAFTGAVALKKGKLETAEGGTVFLDEIGELAPSLQAKLLRVLQERTFERVGGTQTLRLDIRLIAASNRDLAAESKRSGFRLDLYHRLNVVTLKSPPLRDRADDISLLARRFVEIAAVRCGRRVLGISPAAERCLARYPWPGNVRELQNVVEHAVILGSSEWILPGDLPESVLEAAAPADLPSPYHAALGETRRECVLRAWSEADGDHDVAAGILGMHPNSLRRLIRHLGLRENLARKRSLGSGAARV